MIHENRFMLFTKHIIALTSYFTNSALPQFISYLFWLCTEAISKENNMEDWAEICYKLFFRMPIKKIPIVHKFGIISHSQRLELQERILKQSYIDSVASKPFGSTKLVHS